MIIPEIWRPKHAFKPIGRSRKSSSAKSGFDQQVAVQMELDNSLRAVLSQNATNRDYAKLARHGYEDMHLRLSKDGEVLGLRYTKNGQKLIITNLQLGFRRLLHHALVGGQS